MKYFEGHIAWRSAFFSLMEIEQPEEIRMHVAEHCLPDNHYYVPKKENVAAPGMGLDARAGLPQKGKKRYNTKAATRDSDN